MNILIPRLEILPLEQQNLWKRLSETPTNFILYGGTALALRLGHRESIDFDFFSIGEIDTEMLLKEVSYLSGARVVDQHQNTLTCLVDGVQLSYFGLKKWKYVIEPDMAEGANIKVASTLDILGTKLKVIQQRPSWKDYIDIHVILTKANVVLEEGLAVGRIVYGEQFNPLSALRALRYFGDVEGKQLTDAHKKDLVQFIENVDLEKIEEHFLRLQK